MPQTPVDQAQAAQEAWCCTALLVIAAMIVMVGVVGGMLLDIYGD